jgi:hypothetical protein
MAKQMFLLFFAITFILISISAVYALDISVEKKVISDTVLSKLYTPATFEFSITNNGKGDYFEIYSMKSVDFSPKGAFHIDQGETKKIEVGVYPDEKLKKTSGHQTIDYVIHSQNNGDKTDNITFNVAKLEDSFEIYADDINPDSDSVKLHIINKENFDFNDIKISFDSLFFKYSINLSLALFDKKDFDVRLTKDANFKTLTAGNYIINADIQVDNVKAKIKGNINLLEKSGVSSYSENSGFLITTEKTEKKNEGNVPVSVQITLKKDIFSRMFTFFNIPPSKIERQGFYVYYTWEQNLNPTQELLVEANTFWLWPILIVIAIIILIVLFKFFTTGELYLEKRVSFVRTKGGEFALKVHLSAKAKKFIEKIKIIDKLPPLVKLHHRFGEAEPNKIDETNRRIEWNIESMNKGETRAFSYIIFSRIAVVGRFMLPPAVAVYEREGKIKEASSNRAFFINEQLTKKDKIEE